MAYDVGTTSRGLCLHRAAHTALLLAVLSASAWRAFRPLSPSPHRYRRACSTLSSPPHLPPLLRHRYIFRHTYSLPLDMISSGGGQVAPRRWRSSRTLRRAYSAQYCGLWPTPRYHRMSFNSHPFWAPFPGVFAQHLADCKQVSRCTCIFAV